MVRRRAEALSGKDHSRRCGTCHRDDEGPLIVRDGKPDGGADRCGLGNKESERFYRICTRPDTHARPRARGNDIALTTSICDRQ